MNELNEFQVDLRAQIQTVLGNMGVSLADPQTTGEREIYFTAKVADTNLSVFVYSDGAEISSSAIDERFEAPDYDSPELLKSAFLKELVSIVGGADEEL